MKMKASACFHGSRTSVCLPRFIIFFIVLPVRYLEPAQFTVIGPDHPLTALVGEDIDLPCHLSPPMSAEIMEVRWFRLRFSSLVHLYRDGKDQTEDQLPEYIGRTEFLKDGIRNGSVALRLHNINPSDEGQYTCYFQSTSFFKDALLELKVAALGTTPHISVEGFQDGGIRVVCRSAGWYPKPEVFWRDLAGQRLPSLSETISKGNKGLFETQATIIITETSNRNISCYIRSTLPGQERESAMYIADPIFPKMSPWIPVLWTIVVILFLCIGLTMYFFRRKEMIAEERKMIAEERLYFLEKTVEERRWRECLTGAVNVTLDPDTANPHLIISKDLKGARLEETDQELPNDYEGFRYSPCVLGSNRINSGSHFWGVEVGSKGGWALGVARESVRTKKGAVSLKPEKGVWAIERQWWGEFWGLTSPMEALSLSRKPEKIRVAVDYDTGLVEFFDAESIDPFFIFSSTSFAGETIRPFFRVGGAGSHIRLCP